jgi:hypothetical protein
MDEATRQQMAALVRIEITDPRSPDARHCLQAYFDDLNRRFEAASTRRKASRPTTTR